MSTTFEAHVHETFEHAKAVLVRKKAVPPLVILWDVSDRGLLLPLDRLDKDLWGGVMRHALDAFPIEAYCYVFESWLHTAAPDGETILEERSGESLVVGAYHKDGRSSMIMQRFTRTPEGAIEFYPCDDASEIDIVNPAMRSLFPNVFN